MRKTSINLYIALFLILFSGIFIAQGGYGTSSVSLTANSITVYPGNSATLGFNVTLASGYYWGTEMKAINKNPGINISFNPSIGDPNYSGSAAISVSGSMKKGVYSLVLYASGDDPSINNVTLLVNVPVSGTSSPTNSSSNSSSKSSASSNSLVALFTTTASKTILVNASSSSPSYVSVGNISVTVLPGTYMQEGNKTFSSYNFTLVTFSFRNLSNPDSSNTATYAYAFEANHEINLSISFVDFSGNPRAPVSVVKAPSNLSSWTYIGGTFNNTAGTYSGGTYLGEDKWVHNANGTMTNTQFFKPVVWVFTKPSYNQTNSYNQTTTLNQTTQTPQSSTPTITNMYILAAIIIIVIIILIIVFFRMKGR